MAPTIRFIRRYSNHDKYSVNFFGERFFVTVTDNSSAINRWIRDVIYNKRNRCASRPLVVGVGQWIPDSKKSKPPPNNYADSSPESYYIDSPPNNYADSPPASYYSDSPQNINFIYATANYYSDSPSPPESYYSDLPPPRGSYYSDSRPPPTSKESSDNPAETLQLCVGKRCLIIQLRHCDHIPNILRSFLTDPRTKFVGVWNQRDARKLDRCMHQLEIGKLLDIRQYEIGRSNWSKYNLNNDQILQASVDVYVCHKLAIRNRLWRL